MTLQSNLTALESSGLIRLAQAQPELEYLFKHALVQDAAYSSILKQDRKKLHRRIGETLELLYAQRLEEVAPVLAEHFDKAEDEARALKYYTLAADTAAHVYANNEAAMHYARALALAQRGDAATPAQLMHLFTSYGRTLEFLYRYPEALHIYEDMQAVGQARGAPLLELTSLTTRITMFSTPTPLFDTARGRELFEPALALARELNDQQVEVKILWLRLLNSFFSGKFRDGIPFGEQALTLAREINDQEQIAFVLTDLSRSYLAAGKIEQTLACLAEARTLWQNLGNRPMLADVLVSTAETYLLSANYSLALRYGQEGFVTAQAIKNTWGENFARVIIGYTHWELGELGIAVDNLTLGVEQGFAFNIQFLWGMVGDLASLYSQLGVPERGLVLLEEIAPRLQTLPSFFKCWFFSGYVTIYLAQGEMVKAVEAWQRVKETYDPENFFGFSPFSIGMSECQLSFAQGNYTEAIVHTDKFMALLRRYRLAGYFADALTLKAQALMALGRLVEAQASLREACTSAKELNTRRILWQTLFRWSQVEEKLGNVAESRRLLIEAREAFNCVLDHLPQPDLRASFLNTAIVKSLLTDH